MKKLLFTDTETTGLTAEHGIIQIGGIIDVNFASVDSFNIFMQPHPDDKISKKALEVNKRTMVEIETFQPSYKGKSEFDKTMQRHVNKFDKQDKMYCVGWNIEFDKNMMSAWFEKHGDKYMMAYFKYPFFDASQMTAMYLCLSGEIKNVPNMKLGTIGTYLGFIQDTSDLHDAMADISLTRDIFYTFLGKGWDGKTCATMLAQQYRDRVAQ